MTWRKITCAERDEAMARYDLVPISSLTDIDGEFGTPSIFTEWGDRTTEEPCLRDQRWPPRYTSQEMADYATREDDRPCEHYLNEIDLTADLGLS